MKKLITVIVTPLILVSGVIPIKASPNVLSDVQEQELLEGLDTPEPATWLLTTEEKRERHDELVQQYTQQQEIEAVESIVDEPVLDMEFELILETTIRIETGRRRSDMYLYMNNPGGIKLNGQYHTFNTLEEGETYLRNLLLEHYIPVFGYDIRAIREVYCQCPTPNDDDYNLFMELYYELKQEWGVE